MFPSTLKDVGRLRSKILELLERLLARQDQLGIFDRELEIFVSAKHSSLGSLFG